MHRFLRLRRDAAQRRTSESRWASTSGKLVAAAIGLVGGVLGSLATSYLVLGWEGKESSDFALDTIERIEGVGSLKWSFQLKPERRFRFSSSRVPGAFLHAETDPYKTATASGSDWNGFRAIRFQAKTSIEGLPLSEVNLFVGAERVQYSYSNVEKIILTTTWRQVELPLEAFTLPAWVPRQVVGAKPFRRPEKFPEAAHDVSGFGFDLRSSDDEIRGSIWIDSIKLIRPDGSAVPLADGDDKVFWFGPTKFSWFSRAQLYQ